MKVKFERHYGEYKIGDLADFEKGEELNYILNTETAIIIEDDNPNSETIKENQSSDFGNSEIEETEETEKENKKNKKVK
jgi:hypothetical protein